MPVGHINRQSENIRAEQREVDVEDKKEMLVKKLLAFVDNSSRRRPLICFKVAVQGGILRNDHDGRVVGEWAESKSSVNTILATAFLDYMMILTNMLTRDFASQVDESHSLS